MKQLFFLCPDCGSRNFTIYVESFHCLDCNLSISPEVGYHPTKIQELCNLLNDIQNEDFKEFILKDNTIPYEKRIKLINKFRKSSDTEKSDIIFSMLNYMTSKDTIICESVTIDNEYLQTKRRAAKDFFDQFGAIDMVQYFSNNNFIPAIGRELEIQKIENVLMRKDKSSVAIIGPGGSGTSNLGLSVAQRIIQQKVKGLNKCPVYKIDSAFLNVGNVSGDLERTLKDITTHARNSDAVLFFDDCEQLAGQGVHRGTNLDVADRLFSVMDGLKIIFSTSEDKFQEKLSQKSSFLRKVELIKINQLDIEITKQIMSVFSEKLLIEQKTKFTQGIINFLAEISENIKNRYLPDRCITLLEKTALNCKPSKKYDVHEICREDIIKTLADDFNIQLIENETYRKKLCTLSDRLKLFIKGQDSAIDAICTALQTKDFRREEYSGKPVIIMLSGPTGTGKSYLAKKIAELLTLNNAFFRLDMSQFNDYSKLEILTGKSHVDDPDSDFIKWKKNNPGQSVLLLDEWEKSIPLIHNYFLPVFDQGNMRTAKGELLYFDHTIILITSNSIIKEQGLGFAASKNFNLYEEMVKYMSPELTNRIQSIVLFKPLSIEHCKEITVKISEETKHVFKKKGVNLTFSNDVISWITDNGYSPKFNARELDRVWENKMLPVLSKFFFITKSNQWVVDINKSNNEIRIEANN